jgi:hypothetical protein
MHSPPINKSITNSKRSQVPLSKTKKYFQINKSFNNAH